MAAHFKRAGRTTRTWLRLLAGARPPLDAAPPLEAPLDTPPDPALPPVGAGDLPRPEGDGARVVPLDVVPAARPGDWRPRPPDPPDGRGGSGGSGGGATAAMPNCPSSCCSWLCSSARREALAESVLSPWRRPCRAPIAPLPTVPVPWGLLGGSGSASGGCASGRGLRPALAPSGRARVRMALVVSLGERRHSEHSDASTLASPSALLCLRQASGGCFAQTWSDTWQRGSAVGRVEMRAIGSTAPLTPPEHRRRRRQRRQQHHAAHGAAHDEAHGRR